jgi:hypothetical protein
VTDVGHLQLALETIVSGRVEVNVMATLDSNDVDGRAAAGPCHGTDNFDDFVHSRDGMTINDESNVAAGAPRRTLRRAACGWFVAWFSVARLN